MAYEEKDLTDIISKAKSWELGFVRETANGGRQLVLNKEVKIMVGDRILEGSVFFDKTENAVAFLEGLINDGKGNPVQLETLKKRIAGLKATQVVKGSFTAYSSGL